MIFTVRERKAIAAAGLAEVAERITRGERPLASQAALLLATPALHVVRLLAHAVRLREQGEAVRYRIGKPPAALLLPAPVANGGALPTLLEAERVRVTTSGPATGLDLLRACALARLFARGQVCLSVGEVGPQLAQLALDYGVGELESSPTLAHPVGPSELRALILRAGYTPVAADRDKEVAA